MLANNILLWAIMMFLGVVSGACGHAVVHVHALDPRPEIALPGHDRAVHLELSSSIADTISIPPRKGSDEIRVHSWRQTLERGFRHGFGAYAGSDGSRAAWILVLERADVTLQPATTATPNKDTGMLRPQGAMYAHGGPHMKAHRPPRNTFYVRLDYQARLVDAAGQSMGQTSGAVRIQVILRGNARPIETGIQNAVEALYQALATELVTPIINNQ